MRHTFASATFILSLTALLPAAHAADPRQLVEMPGPMQEHMLSNMRDNLLAMSEILEALGKNDFDRAADVAEQRIGMGSLKTHDSSHLTPYMPKGMQETGAAMHHAASRFALVAQEAGVTNDMPRALSALAELTQQCAGCHAGYRLR